VAHRPLQTHATGLCATGLGKKPDSANQSIRQNNVFRPVVDYQHKVTLFVAKAMVKRATVAFRFSENAIFED
jgi:hypothetical protein